MRGCGAALVGDELCDGRVGLVADRRDDRHAAGVDCLGDHELVEAPEVLHRAAAAGEEERIDAEAGVRLREVADHRRDLCCCGVALHTHVADQHVYGGTAIAHGAQHILQRGPRRAGYDRDSAWECWQCLLRGRIEPSTLAKVLDQALEGEFLLALPCGLE